MKGARWIVPALFAAAGCTIDAFPVRAVLGDGGTAGCGEAGVVDLFSNRNHCGSCTVDCVALPHVLSSGVSCSVGRCIVGTCAPGWLNCDGNPDNGCEADVRDPTSCGRCGVTCRDATPLCRAFAAAPTGRGDGGAAADAAADAAGVPVDDVSFEGDAGAAVTFRCVDNCPAGRVRCDDPPACVDLMTDQRACGACGTACVPRANAATACVAGSCAPTCLASFRDCNGDLARATSDGCEVNTATSTTSCGACGTSCPAGQNRLARCLDGVCAPGECMAGFGDCDADPANGCETTLATSAAHCGMCGRACEFANAGATCAAGACMLTSCNAGFGNCNGVNADGCETNTRSNIDHCGDCATACPTRPNSSPTCADGACGVTCIVNRGNCDGQASNGCETFTDSDRLNCNGCGVRCPMFCIQGTCL